MPEPGDGEVLLRTLWLSFDPAQRGWLNDVRSYVPPVAIGEPMRAYGIGEVVTSNADGVEARRPRAHVARLAGLRRRRPGGDTLFEPVPAAVTQPEMMLGLLGMTGLTAYFGMTDIGRPVEGDAVLVTAAAGATGSIAGQIARIKGATQVIGTAGAEEKRAWVRDVAGFDDCLDHYDENILRLIRAANRDGYQVVFDNVGGTLLDACLFNIAVHARVVLCGSISTGYKPQRPDVGIYYYQLLTMRRSLMQGFLVSDYAGPLRRGPRRPAALVGGGPAAPAVRHRRGPRARAERRSTASSRAATSASSSSSSEVRRRVSRQAVEQAGGPVGQRRHRRARSPMRGSLLSPRTKRWYSCSSTTHVFQVANASYQGHVGDVEAGPGGVALDDLGPRRQAHVLEAGTCSGRSPSTSAGSGQ